jgi:hypothetical protein
MSLLQRQKITLVSLILYWPTLFVLSHIPVPQFVREAGVSDKCLHFLAYLILVFLFWFAVKPTRKVNWRRLTAWWILLVVAGYGAADELIQRYVGRTCDIEDFAANLVGIIAGLLLFSFFTFWPAALLVAGATIFGLTNIARANLAELMPALNAMFHLFSYAIFSMLWLQVIHLNLTLKPPKLKWLFVSLALPLALLLTTKVFSVIIGRTFGPIDVILAVSGIATVVAVTYLTALFRQRATPPER